VERGSDSTREVNGQAKTNLLLSTSIPNPGPVIHRFVNVYLSFMRVIHAENMPKTIALFALLSLSFHQPAQHWQMPLDGPVQLARPYLQPTSDYSSGHRGVDLAVHLSQDVLAPADATVSFVGHLVSRDVLTLSHDGGLVSEFEPACAVVKVGQLVRAGQPIAKACDADPTYQQHCQGLRCIHFSVRLNGKYLSPLALIGGLSPTRLLAN
jgi:murein DD-endopeptidase MepM/ murein hydrolase activator NlpD